jgi:hypothetical protein
MRSRSRARDESRGAGIPAQHRKDRAGAVGMAPTLLRYVHFKVLDDLML